jgi:flagellar basal-body rod modification protein FlgD
MSSTTPVTTNVDRLPGTTQATTTAGSNALGKNEFLKLLTTQLQYQDPLSPMDNSEFIAQLAQFSQVEQLQGVGSRLDTLLIAQASANQLNTASLVGREIRFRSDAITVTGTGAPTSFEVTLDAAATSGSAVITDSSGRTVRTIQLGLRNAGTSEVEWDGLDQNGKPVPAGDYVVTLSAAAADKSKVGTSLSVRGVVAGVTFENQAPELLVAGRQVKMSDVVQINAP